jgi:membrane fusion protein (multidrug efflux system)
MDNTSARVFWNWKWVLAAIGCSILIVAVLFLLVHKRATVWTNDAYIDGYQVSISPDIEARLIELYVDEGDVVQAGDLLCQLDESIYNAKKIDAETNVSLLGERVKLQKIFMEKLRDIYQVAGCEYQNQIISFIDFDKIEKDFRYAEMQYKVAEAELTNGIAKLGVIQEYLRHTKVYAPRSGAIAKRWVVGGDALHIGQPLFSLTDTDVWVTAHLEEGKLEHVQKGDPVAIRIDAYPDEHFEGTVYAVRQAAASQFALIPPDNATGNFTKVVQRVPIKILLKDLPKKTPYLYPGMSVEVRIKIR